MRTRRAWAISVLPLLVVDAVVAGWPGPIQLFFSWVEPVSQGEWSALLASWFLLHAVVTFFAPWILGAWIGTFAGHVAGGFGYLIVVLPNGKPLAGLFVVVALYGGAVGLLGCAAASLVRGYLPARDPTSPP